LRRLSLLLAVGILALAGLLCELGGLALILWFGVTVFLPSQAYIGAPMGAFVLFAIGSGFLYLGDLLWDRAQLVS
jgi:hypothetical protein